jgi:glycosyltransferase involved in cell wall biosynthesis
MSDREQVLADAAGPRVSVVIPVHNAAAHLGTAIGSALSSDLRDLEVIVVDDGSTDASLSIARSLEDPRLIVIQQSASGGPSRPRNVGIARARAPYVAFLDADDQLRPDKLSGAVAALEAHPQAGIAFGDYERIDATGALLCGSVLAAYPELHRLAFRPWGERWRVIPQNEFARGLLYENFIGTSGVVLRRSVLRKVGLFDETLNFSEDRDLWFRIAHECDALYRDAVGHSYRISAGGLTLRPGSRQDRQRIAVLRRERARWTSTRERRQLDRLIAENLGGIAWDHRAHGRRLASIVTFGQAFLTSPSPRWLRGAVRSLWAQTSG